MIAALLIIIPSLVVILFQKRRRYYNPEIYNFDCDCDLRAVVVVEYDDRLGVGEVHPCTYCNTIYDIDYINALMEKGEAGPLKKSEGNN